MKYKDSGMQSGACELIKTLTLFRLGYFGKRYVCGGGGGGTE